MFETDLKVMFVEGNEAILLDDLIYSSAEYGDIIVPKGFRTDFASVPGFIILPGVVPRVGRVRWAAVVHDYLYRVNPGSKYTRQEADEIFYEAAKEQGLSTWRAWVAWAGVRIGGWKAWNN